MDHSQERPDYDVADSLVVKEPERQRALAHELRNKILGLLRERALSISQLAEKLAVPKGTVGHHVKVLEDAELVRVVRTRRVRAVTEKFYGRTARLFIVKGDEDPEATVSLAQLSLREASEEIARSWDSTETRQSLLHVRLTQAEARRFRKRLDRLVDDFTAHEAKDGDMYGFVTGFYPMPDE